MFFLQIMGLPTLVLTLARSLPTARIVPDRILVCGATPIRPAIIKLTMTSYFLTPNVRVTRLISAMVGDD